MNMVINNQDDLIRVCDLLHDARIEGENIQYNSIDMKVNIIVDRDLMGVENIRVIKNYGLCKKYAHPIIQSMLQLEDVVQCQIITKDPSLKIHTFSECLINPKENSYEFSFSEVMRVVIRFKNNPVGIFKDLDGSKKGEGYFWLFKFPFRFSLSRK